MKKKSIMGIEYKWEVLLIYLLFGGLLGFIFSFMKEQKVDKDVRFQYNQAGTIFIIELIIGVFNSVINVSGIPVIGIVVWPINILIFVFAIITVVKAFEGETYRIPVIADFSDKIWK